FPEDDVSDYGTDDEEDLINPRITVLRRQCVRATCNLLVQVDDPEPSAGIDTVEATVKTVSKACAAKVAKKTKRCAKASRQRRLKVHSGGGDIYSITATRLKRGRQTFRIHAFDDAGNVGAKRVTIKSKR
ncbi:MAG TPA: hypothetical protein VNT22_06460, partial [Baekduia sp.]|nr:hypothetical protein [Baekduia sp.]